MGIPVVNVNVNIQSDEVMNCCDHSASTRGATNGAASTPGVYHRYDRLGECSGDVLIGPSSGEGYIEPDRVGWCANHPGLQHKREVVRSIPGSRYRVIEETTSVCRRTEACVRAIPGSGQRRKCKPPTLACSGRDDGIFKKA